MLLLWRKQGGRGYRPRPPVSGQIQLAMRCPLVSSPTGRVGRNHGSARFRIGLRPCRYPMRVKRRPTRAGTTCSEEKIPPGDAHVTARCDVLAKRDGRRCKNMPKKRSTVPESEDSLLVAAAKAIGRAAGRVTTIGRAPTETRSAAKSTPVRKPAAKGAGPLSQQEEKAR
jgi:hypothetical protein